MRRTLFIFSRTQSPVLCGLMLLVMTIFLSSCAVTQPVEADRDMGQDVVKQVEDEMGIFNDPGRTEYLNAIGQRLARTLGDQRFVYSFQIVNQPESNAFAAPGGYIFVSRGLLALTNNEEELANVIGHEIIHVNQRHTAKQLAKARAPSLLALPGAIVGNVGRDREPRPADGAVGKRVPVSPVLAVRNLGLALWTGREVRWNG